LKNKYFGKHWKYFEIDGLSVTKVAEAKEFLEPALKEMRKKSIPLRVLDAGCGDGVHAVVLKSVGELNGRYSGIDLSCMAVKIAKKRIEKPALGNFDFQAGDVLNLPYSNDVFDIVFSYGVLYYTGSIEQGIEEMSRVCKNKGLVGLWVFPEVSGIGGRLFKFTRWLCKLFGRRFSKLIVWLIVPLMPFLPLRSGMNLKNASWKQCSEVISVNLLPEVFEFSTTEKVIKWFNKNNLEIEYIDRRRPIAVWGRKIV